eukprot:TRINITY_DN12457_c0_g1_i1.p2 TRINITY_DN12457_c0_g1~~TRINITY_DN12457_c0_g1_i1.p2  ORF type:complete len:122 (+),score=19.78 TRINITY_DN12457_c0_g1_i1:299-664(+)
MSRGHVGCPLAPTVTLLTVVVPPAAPNGERQLHGNGKNGEAAEARQTPRRRPLCGRQPFKAGNGDVEAADPHLRDEILAPGKSSRRELLSLVTAINIDSVALPFLPHHSQTLRDMSDVVRR